MRTLARSWLIGAVLFMVSSVPAQAYKKIKCFMPQAPQVDLAGIDHLAVLDFKPGSSDDTEICKFISDKMIEYLLMEERGIQDIGGGLFSSGQKGATLVSGISSHCFDVIERSRLHQVLNEQHFGEAGYVTDDEVSRLGELMGVQVVCTGGAHGTLDEKTSYQEVHSSKKGTYTEKCVTRKATVTADIRILDTTTGQVLGVDTVSKSSSDKVCGGERALRELGIMFGECCTAIAWEFTNAVSPWFQFEEFELEKIKDKEAKDRADKAAEHAEDNELYKAWAIYSELYSADSYNPQYAYNLGILCEVTGDFARAAELYAEALTLKDEGRYRDAVERIESRMPLISFCDRSGMPIIVRDFESAASDESLTAEIITVKGDDRVSIYEKPETSSPVIVSVPKGIRLTVLGEEGSFYEVELKGGDHGYIEKENADK